MGRRAWHTTLLFHDEEYPEITVDLLRNKITPVIQAVTGIAGLVFFEDVASGKLELRNS